MNALPGSIAVLGPNEYGIRKSARFRTQLQSDGEEHADGLHLGRGLASLGSLGRLGRPSVAVSIS